MQQVLLVAPRVGEACLDLGCTLFDHFKLALHHVKKLPV